MPRAVTLYFPPEDFEWYRQALDRLAADVVPDSLAGQRGTKVSIFVRMLLTAYIADARGTVAALDALIAAQRGGTQERIFDEYNHDLQR
jgi:hypothetical protein